MEQDLKSFPNKLFRKDIEKKEGWMRSESNEDFVNWITTLSFGACDTENLQFYDFYNWFRFLKRINWGILYIGTEDSTDTIKSMNIVNKFSRYLLTIKNYNTFHSALKKHMVTHESVSAIIK